MASYTTPTGTAWSSYSATMADGSVGRRMIRDDLATATDIPCLLYFHGAGSGSNQFETLSAWKTLRDQLMDMGWAVVETSGGPTVSGGQQNWGNPASRTSGRQAFDWADAVHDFSDVVTLGRSMGGMNGYYFGVRSTIKSRVRGMIINSGVSNLIAANNVPAEGNAGSGSGKFWPTMWDAYEIPAGTDAERKAAFAASSVVADCDPHQYSPALFDGVNILQLYGTADQTVPGVDHALAMRTLYAGRPAIDRVVVGDGRDHSSGNGMYSYADDMIAFMLEVTGGTPPVPDEMVYYRVIASRQLRPDGYHAITRR